MLPPLPAVPVDLIISSDRGVPPNIMVMMLPAAVQAEMPEPKVTVVLSSTVDRAVKADSTSD